MAGQQGEPGTGEPAQPPRDAEDWTEAQWLAWLRAGDDSQDDRPATGTGRASRSVGGQILGNAMLGIAEALDIERPKVVVQAEAPSDPHGDDLAVHLDPDDPARSTVVVRSGRRGRRPRRPGDGPRRDDPRSDPPRAGGAG